MLIGTKMVGVRPTLTPVGVVPLTAKSLTSDIATPTPIRDAGASWAKAHVETPSNRNDQTTRLTPHLQRTVRLKADGTVVSVRISAGSLVSRIRRSPPHGPATCFFAST